MFVCCSGINIIFFSRLVPRLGVVVIVFVVVVGELGVV